MTIDGGVAELGAADLALRLTALRGTAAYVAYVVAPDLVDPASSELGDELRGFDASIEIATLRPGDGAQLIHEIAAIGSEIAIVIAPTFVVRDWELIDRRRSSLARRGIIVLVTTPPSFDALMQSAPNLSSWLGGLAFAYPRDDEDAAKLREQRLGALRAWASKSDEEVVREAELGTLPREPEYAEWLVLIGRGDLLQPRET